ncbi:MAG TPA: nucleotide exchange factor GrpE [Saprospiraceae bacterium]|nr:nucleotide exchange factor GrpE [Saprospiraceae bacterium]
MKEEVTKEQEMNEKKSSRGNKKIKELEMNIQTLENELSESRDKFLRLYAEFENYKKRNIKERLEILKNASKDTIQSLLPVLDDFDRAKKSSEDENSEEHFSDGVLLVYQKLYKVLGTYGLKEMETKEIVFDPELHEAITEIPSPNEELKGKIVDTVEKGYYLNDKILRHAKVVVGK